MQELSKVAQGCVSQRLHTPTTPTPITLVSSIDGPQVVNLQLQATGCHHRSLQIGFNLLIQVGTEQRPLPTPMRLLEFLPFLLRIQARSAPEISTGRLVVALGGVIMRVLAVAKTGEAPASEKCAWARTTLHSIAANPVRDEHPATRARQKEDLVDDVLTRHLHLTRLLVQGGQALHTLFLLPNKYPYRFGNQFCQQGGCAHERACST